MQINSQVFTGVNSPIYYDSDGLVYESSRQTISFQIGAREELLVSVFINVLKTLDPSTYAIKNLQPAVKKSFYKHFRLKPKLSTPITLSVKLSPQDIHSCIPENYTSYLPHEQRHKMCVRIELIGNSERFVLSTFYKTSLESEKLLLIPEEAYLEIKNKSFKLLDIFGLDQKRALTSTPPLENCIICFADKNSVVIMPCRHLCVCYVCSQSLNRITEFKKRSCPLCREPIVAFVRLKQLETGENLDSV